MSEADKSYELTVLKMILNKYLDETTSTTEESLRRLEEKRDEVVWDLATQIYSQSGHKTELSIVRDVVDLRIGAIQHKLAAEKERIAKQAAEEAHRIAEQKAKQAAEETRKLATRETHLKNVENQSSVAEYGEEELKAKIFERLCQTITYQLNVDWDKITLDSHISNDLGIDEMDINGKLIPVLEEEFEEFKIEIPEDLLGGWTKRNNYMLIPSSACTVGQLLNFIQERALERE